MENLTAHQRYEKKNPGRWRKYYLANKEKVDARVRGWRLANPDKVKLYSHRQYLKNRAETN